MATAVIKEGKLQICRGLTATERTGQVPLPRGGIVAAVSVTDGGGSGFNSGTCTLQVSLDGTTWFNYLDPTGAAATFTANGYIEVNTAAGYISVLADASISDVDVTFLCHGV